MPIKANDFIEVEYTGRLKDGDVIFDTTDEAVAKAHDLPKAMYGPVVIVVGQGQLLKGLEDTLVGRELGSYTIELSAEKAFGKKNAKLIQMIPTKKFHEQKIQPVPGLQLNIDGMVCTVLQVTGGRAMVDFNNPLSGKDVVYAVKIIKLVTDKKEQLKAVFAMLLNINDPTISIEGNKAKITLKQPLPPQIVPELQKKLKELTGLDTDIALPAPAADQPPKSALPEKKEGKDEHAGHDHAKADTPKQA